MHNLFFLRHTEGNEFIGAPFYDEYDPHLVLYFVFVAVKEPDIYYRDEIIVYIRITYFLVSCSYRLLMQT